jgi:hypothetical protein
MPTTNPLEQLKDIHLPDAIGFWPPALGWWLLAALLIAVFITAMVLYKHRQKSAYRRAAVKQVKKLFSDYKEPQQSHELTGQLNRLLKAVALQSYPTKQVSRLTQKQWLEFLDNSANMQVFRQGAGEILASAPYDKNSELTDIAALKRCSIAWIRGHR